MLKYLNQFLVRKTVKHTDSQTIVPQNTNPLAEFAHIETGPISDERIAIVKTMTHQSIGCRDSNLILSDTVFLVMRSYCIGMT